MAAVKPIVVALVALLFLVAGVMHFAQTDKFVKIVPPYLPWPRLAVYVSGCFEIAGAIGLFIPSLRRFAAWGLVALLVSVFPANVYMATASIQVSASPVPQWLLWARLPLQAVLIWIALWCTEPPRTGTSSFPS